MVDQLGTSKWSVSEARGWVARFRHVADDGPEYDGVELFLALCDYLDELHGGAGFDYVRTGPEQQALTAAIRAVRGPNPVPDPLGERLVQPVNAAVTLADGRALTTWLEERDGWQQELGKALHALYSYLDQLYGGPGAFDELLTTAERSRVAAR
ncbi:hypothetical protein PWY87_24940 [Kribbella solani]|uniref:hypothetical protein n=1 Tax=Kribbella solani TaxID=236067 RepID=UPI0029B069C1|nr:hypothetical protein [Kribbella solani]MDX2970591.1 hypothetical protein [Kribbella solani]MDX3004955.1 hypothetical protein [Kribbella solani]